MEDVALAFDVSEVAFTQEVRVILTSLTPVSMAALTVWPQAGNE